MGIDRGATLVLVCALAPALPACPSTGGPTVSPVPSESVHAAPSSSSVPTQPSTAPSPVPSVSAATPSALPIPSSAPPCPTNEPSGAATCPAVGQRCIYPRHPKEGASAYECTCTPGTSAATHAAWDCHPDPNAPVYSN